MPEYIEREAAIDEIDGTTWYHISCQENLVEGAACEADAFYKATDIYNVIKSAPTADVVEVVRCKNCKNYELMKSGNSHFCNEFGGRVTEEDFCSRGARMDGATDTNVGGKLKEGAEE